MTVDIPDIEFPEYTPYPLCRNAHLQTVLPLFLPSRYKPPEGEKRRVELEDGDAIVVRENTPASWKVGDRIILLVHGLCGSHRSQYVMRVTAKLLERGFKTIRIDMRGFGDSQNVSRGHMHAGRSDDVRSVLSETIGRFEGSPVSVIGFSLGANITLKMLCEFSQDPPTQLDSSVVVAPPVDLLRCTLNLQKGLNRFYDSYFAKLLARAVKSRRSSGNSFDDLPVENFPKRLLEFDNQYTAPANGFADAKDYYAKCSTHQLLDRVSVPTLLIAAQDDPIVPYGMYEEIKSPYLKKLVSPGGGHLGFIAQKKSGDPDRRWMDWRILEWIDKQTKC